MSINLNNIVDILPNVFKIIQDGAKDDFGGNQSLYLDLERSILESALECFESKESKVTSDDGGDKSKKQNHNDVIITQASDDSYKTFELSDFDKHLVRDKCGTMNLCYANIYPYVGAKYGS